MVNGGYSHEYDDMRPSGYGERTRPTILLDQGREMNETRDISVVAHST